jgi:uncharacterized protein with PIN domain
MSHKTAIFRFYEELNDLLPTRRQKVPFRYAFDGSPSVKDAIEAIGVPHTEVDLIVVEGRSVGFGHRLRDGDRIAVYPTFEAVDITPITRLKARPLREVRFVADTHLGKLARLMRMMGFDTVYHRDFEDAGIVALSIDEHRIILTRDRGILKRKTVTHGYCLRSTQPKEQAQEVLERFDLRSQIEPFARCMLCNGRIVEANADEITNRLLPRTAADFDEFYVCESCDKVYWRGSHYDKMKALIDTLRSAGHNEGSE